MRILAAMLLIGLGSEAWAEDLFIDMTTDDAFSVRVAQIEVGQTITWLPTAKGHNVEFAKGPSGVQLSPKYKLSKEVSVKSIETGV